MTDRELLELAAKAAGWLNTEYQDMRGWGEVRYGLSEAIWVPELDAYWNPLADDGHALRLAVKLRMCLELDRHDYPRDESAARIGSGMPAYESHGDPCAATRRAIVRAAAEIGRP